MTDGTPTADDAPTVDDTPTADHTVTRSATIRTRVKEAHVVAAAVRPDNTPEIDTRVEDRIGAESGGGDEIDDGSDRDEEDGDARGTGVVVTTVERETTGGLRTTVDDYVVNLAVAQEVVQTANRYADANADATSADATDADRPDTHHTQP